MSKAKFAEPILETIDQLRSRKARPDLARICHMVERRHGLSADEVHSTLAAMVAENLVIKVNYKGNISYRNPAKWKRRKRAVTDESPDRKGKSTMRAKLPNKKLLKLKAVKAVLTKTKGKRGRPPLKKKVKVKPPASDVDEETEEEVLDVSLTTQACDESERCDESKDDETETQNKESEKSDVESVPDVSADDTASSRSSKAGLGRQTGQKGTTKYELVKGKRSDARSTSKLSTAESDQSANENSSSNILGEGSKSDIQSKVVSPKKIKPVAHKRRFRKNLDTDIPSDLLIKKARNDVVSEKSDSKSSSSQSEKENKDLKCDYCLQTAASNRIGEPEDLLICKDCQAKAHPSCMDYSEELARRACRSPWQCIDCKTCSICNDSGDADAMLFCDACDKGYHMNCHQPPIKEKPKGKWVCCQCVLELGVDVDEISKDESNEVNPDLNMDESIPAADGGGASCLPTPNDSPVHFTEEANGNKLSSKLTPNVVAPLPRLAATLTLEVPDASGWAIVDVVRFFYEMGFTEQAEAFREQEIDGRALLLMTRMDVLTGLALKLGPALKIYVHIQRLQAKHLNSH